MVQVLITVDTEAYPILEDWKSDRLQRDIARDIYGRIGDREVGLDYQLRVFAEHNLKANFMVESLFSACPDVGLDPLKRVVSSILAGGHEVHLHPHTEWIPYAPGLNLPYRSHLLRAFPLQEQVQIISFAKQQLELAGAPPPIAFRAGGFAANSDTLAALELCGVRYDSSYNPCYQDTHLHLPQLRSFGQVTAFGAVQEVPVSVFNDRPSHLRPAQICACSSTEMIHALNAAEAAGWDFFVIVSHSFEMIARTWSAAKPPIVRREVVRRFEDLCTFLGSNPDRFRTVGFSDLRLSGLNNPIASIKGNPFNTGYRLFEQAVARFRATMSF